MYIKIFPLLLLPFVIISCSKPSSSSSSNNTPLQASVLKNVAYSTTDSIQKMDLYLPAGRTDSTTPVVVLIHGGAWSSGDKSDFNAGISALQTLLPNYAFVTINYRLAAPPSTNLWPVQLYDVESALQNIEANSANYVCNSQKIVVLGASAGGHLALLKAYQNNDLNIKAVVDLYGPTDMSDLYQFNVSFQQLLSLFLGGTPSLIPVIYKEASPLYYVSKSSPPTIVFLGAADSTVPIHESDSLVNRLNAFGVVNQYVKYPNAGHAYQDSATLSDTYLKTAAFLKANVQ